MLHNPLHVVPAMSRLSRRTEVDQKVAQIYGVVSFYMVLATLLVIFRLIFRKTLNLERLADDYFMVLATVCLPRRKLRRAHNIES